MFEPPHNLTGTALDTLVGAAWAILWALVGRLLYITNMIRLGKRKSFSLLQTMWELGVAIGMGVIAGGVGEYLKLGDLEYAGFISAVSYIGPRIVDYALEALDRWVNKQV